MPHPNDFIKSIRDSFIGSELVYTNGSCVMFYLILKQVYRNARPYWNEQTRHMITKIGNRYYDITGELEYTKGYFLETDELQDTSIAVALPTHDTQMKRFPVKKKLF